MKKNSVSEFELEKQDFKIKLKRGPNGGASTVGYEEASQVVYAAPSVITSGTPVAPALPVAASGSEAEIKSPMIGTFYRSPSPESGSYVEVGTEVGPETVVCII